MYFSVVSWLKSEFYSYQLDHCFFQAGPIPQCDFIMIQVSASKRELEGTVKMELLLFFKHLRAGIISLPMFDHCVTAITHC